VNPYQGSDGVEPYLRDAGRGAFMLCKTSNPGSVDFQDLLVEQKGERRPLYEVVARKAVEWNTRGNVGLVVGVTFPADLARVRALAPDLPILIPGVGAQGGDASDAMTYGAAADGTLAVVNASRQVLYASAGPDWAEAARREALALREALRLPASSRS
jgi:orotidine-5'-phosphate decarboxylase